MRKILIFGNSGSGKSTLAKKLCRTDDLSHLDLDSLAWTPTIPPERKPLSESESNISDFIGSHTSWVIEGCYSDLLELALSHASEMVFMNLPVAACIDNARRRPWEPHKYDSKEIQDSNLEMLINWISEYPNRTDTFSKASHVQLYEKFAGKKSMITANV